MYTYVIGACDSQVAGSGSFFTLRVSFFYQFPVWSLQSGLMFFILRQRSLTGKIAFFEFGKNGAYL